MAQSDFSFLDDLVNPPKETPPTLSPDEIQKLKDEQTLEELNSEEFNQAKKTFSKLDMSSIPYSQIYKSKMYYCVIVNRLVMGQNEMPFLYHRDLQEQTIQIAKENNGHLIRADKCIPDFLTAIKKEDCQVILVHRAKSTKQILEQQKIDKLKRADANKKPAFVSIQYDNRTLKHFKMPSELVPLQIELGWHDPEHDPTSVFEDNKYVVFPSKYLFGQGNLEVINAIGIIERHVNTLREREGKKPIASNKYYVCNQDEPYAEKVLKTILQGEDSKLHNK